MPITPQSSSKAELFKMILSQFETILLVIWSANGNGSALTAKANSNLLNDDTYRMILTDAFVRLPIRTNRARCVLFKKILDLLDEENISGESSGRASL